MNIHTSHRLIFLLPASIYVVLVLLVAILPAWQAQEAEKDIEPPLVLESEAWGREIYREQFNCVVCHTQQVRADTRQRLALGGGMPVLAPDARFGLEGPTEADDYAHQEAPMLGTQRTGPDLSSVGRRLPGQQWHFWHLYDPRSVSPGSTMEAYPYLFSRTRPEPERGVDPVLVDAIASLGLEGELWATPRAVALVDYLLSLTHDEPEAR